MIKKIALTCLILLLVVGAIVGVKFLQIRALIASGKNLQMPPEAVTTAHVERQSWLPAYTAVGDVVAVQGVTVSTETPGKIVALSIESGALVKEGDLLIELDASMEKAQLASAEATAQLARINLQRTTDLRRNQTIAQSDLDTAEAQAKQAEAQIANATAALAKKSIRAPFSGRLGLRLVNLGQFVASGQAIVSLQSIDPVYVDFYLPQQNLAGLKPGLGVEVTLDTEPKSQLKGEVTALADSVAADTRNIKVRATLENPTGILRTGMFVTTRVSQAATHDVLVIPATAVIYASFGDSVFIVQKNSAGDGFVASQKFVRLGETRGDYVEVTQGLSADDTIVSTGAFKLRTGSAVTIHNDHAPEMNLAPKPSDS